MARNLELNLSEFLHALSASMDDIADGAKRGMHDVLDEWKREAVDIAPIDKATLRRGIQKGEIKQNSDGLTGEITANAVEVSNGKRFNYAYYIHENDAGGKKLRTPGTVKKFLDQPAERHGSEWMRIIEDEIKDELKRKGWS